jgi:FkbM family methyltransferase
MNMAGKNNKNFLDYPIFNRRVFKECAAILFFFQGKLTPRELVLESARPFLRDKSKAKEAHAKFAKLFSAFVEKRIGPFALYGNPVFSVSGNCGALFSLGKEIIQGDEYHSDLIKNGDTVIDAGANIGFFSIKVAHDFPGTKVCAFEPAPETFETLKKNTKPYANILCFNVGLGDEVAQRELGIWDEAPEANNFDRLEFNESLGKPDRTQSVGITTIDQFAKDLPAVNFIKIDAEGYEAKILKGAAETIKKYKPVIVMSAYHHKDDVHELPKLLNAILPGYDVKLENRADADFICTYAVGQKSA